MVKAGKMISKTSVREKTGILKLCQKSGKTQGILYAQVVYLLTKDIFFLESARVCQVSLAFEIVHHKSLKLAQVEDKGNLKKRFKRGPFIKICRLILTKFVKLIRKIVYLGFINRY